MENLVRCRDLVCDIRSGPLRCITDQIDVLHKAVELDEQQIRQQPVVDGPSGRLGHGCCCYRQEQCSGK